MNSIKKEKNLKILSIIPARGGSIGIPHKNIVSFDNKPLIYHTIKASSNSNHISRTIVSTDDKIIARISKSLGAEVIKRPSNLATSLSPLEPVIKHVLTSLKTKENYVPDIIVILSVTSPLRTVSHIDNAIQLLLNRNLDSVVSGFMIHTFLWEIQHNNLIKPINYNPLKRPNRQSMNHQFFENGSFFITTNNAFKNSNCRISGKIGYYKMPLELSYNIDTTDDLKDAEAIRQMKKTCTLTKNKKIILTGASGLLGTEIKKYLETNNDLISLDIALGHDLTNESFVKKWFRENKADCLINCFAINDHVAKNQKRPTLFDISLNSFSKILDVNLTALFSVCREFARNNSTGSIINFSATTGIVSARPDIYDGGHKHIAYSISKAGVINLTKFLSTHLAPNIRINSIAPGGVENNQGKKFLERYSNLTPLKRMMKRDELNGIVDYLCSDLSSYTTGSTFLIDGGWTSW